MKVKCISNHTRYGNCFFSNIEVGAEYKVIEKFYDIIGVEMYMIEDHNNKNIFHRSELFQIIE